MTLEDAISSLNKAESITDEILSKGCTLTRKLGVSSLTCPVVQYLSKLVEVAVHVGIFSACTTLGKEYPLGEKISKWIVAFDSAIKDKD